MHPHMHVCMTDIYNMHGVHRWHGITLHTYTHASCMHIHMRTYIQPFIDSYTHNVHTRIAWRMPRIQLANMHAYIHHTYIAYTTPIRTGQMHACITHTHTHNMHTVHKIHNTRTIPNVHTHIHNVHHITCMHALRNIHDMHTHLHDIHDMHGVHVYTCIFNMRNMHAHIHNMTWHHMTWHNIT